ncbi:MAG: hypothetical protein NC489_32900 [Ruminococcus flavefaciens]|nr:hypothetical protein [Ruminococcus flavefaciens]
MEIKKINDRIEPEEQFDKEPKSCLHDCVVYYSKTKDDYDHIVSQGFKADGTQTEAEIREIKKIFGFYCFRKEVAKTTSIF